MDDSYWQIYLQFEKELKEIMCTISFDKKAEECICKRKNGRRKSICLISYNPAITWIDFWLASLQKVGDLI